MINQQIKIDLSRLLGPNYNTYGAILSENHPQVAYQKGHNGPPLVSYLWYPIELGQIPNTFTKYFREKLAVTNTSEALQIINDWNTKYIPTARIVKQFKIGNKQFTAIADPSKSENLIVLANYSDRPAYTETVHAGSGGYIWQRLPAGQLRNDLTTHGVLRTKLCLKLMSERDRFTQNW